MNESDLLWSILIDHSERETVKSYYFWIIYMNNCVIWTRVRKCAKTHKGKKSQVWSNFPFQKKFKSHYFLVHYCYVSRVELAFLNKRKWKKCCYQFWGIPNYEMERVYLVPEKSLNQSECCSRKKNPKSVQEVAQIVIWRFFWGDILNVANS